MNTFNTFNNINDMIGGKQKEIGDIEWIGEWTKYKITNTLEDKYGTIYQIKAEFNGYYIMGNITSPIEKINGTWTVFFNNTDIKKKIGKNPDELLKELKSSGNYTSNKKTDNLTKKMAEGNIIDFSFCYDNDHNDIKNSYKYRYITDEKWNSQNNRYKGSVSYESYDPYLEGSMVTYLNAEIDKKSTVYKELLKIRSIITNNNNNFSPHMTLLNINFYKKDSNIIDKLGREGGSPYFPTFIKTIKMLYNIHIKDVLYTSYINNENNYEKLGDFIAKKYIDRNKNSYKKFIDAIANHIIKNIVEPDNDVEILSEPKIVNNTKFIYYSKIDNKIKTELFAIRDHNYDDFLPHISIFSNEELVSLRLDNNTVLNRLKESRYNSKYLPMWKTDNIKTTYDSQQKINGCINDLKISVSCNTGPRVEKIDL